MSPRHRLGVALLLDPPVAAEVEGLRRALGDSSLGHIGPHITLVPPVNVPAGDLGQAVDVLRTAAFGQPGPLELALGPVATFWPLSPVVYLTVGGPGLADLGRLQQAVAQGPLERPARWPWSPHVTICDDATSALISASVLALASYTAPVTLDRVVLMEETVLRQQAVPLRRWSALADACLGPPAVVGRGGLELEITEGRLAGPDVIAMARAQPEAGDELLALLGPPAVGAGPPLAEDWRATAAIVLSARREGRVVGLAVARPEGRPGGAVHVCALVDAGVRRQGVGRALVMALEARVRRRGWSMMAVAHGPQDFYSSCGAWPGPAGPGDGP